ncbi:type II secretion system F family protein [Cryobacterium sp. AP23]
MSRPPQIPPIEEVARVAERLAVLLAAGVSPVSAWDYLLPTGPPEPSSPALEPTQPPLSRRARTQAEAERAQQQPESQPPSRRARSLAEAESANAPRAPLSHRARAQAEPEPALVPRPPLSRRARTLADAERAQRSILTAASRAARNGGNVADAIADASAGLPDQLGDAWRALAAAWDVATRAGAPLSGCLRDLAAAFRELGQLHRDLTVALTGPRATARLVMVLPLVALLFGSLMGFDTLRTLFLTGPGLACLAVGSALMFAAARWNRRLVRRAQAGGPAPGLELDLTAIGMTGGGSLDGARRTARHSAERFGLRAADASDTATDATSTGSSPSPPGPGCPPPNCCAARPSRCAGTPAPMAGSAPKPSP